MPSMYENLRSIFSQPEPARVPGKGGIDYDLEQARIKADQSLPSEVDPWEKQGWSRRSLGIVRDIAENARDFTQGRNSRRYTTANRDRNGSIAKYGTAEEKLVGYSSNARTGNPIDIDNSQAWLEDIVTLGALRDIDPQWHTRKPEQIQALVNGIRFHLGNNGYDGFKGPVPPDRMGRFRELSSDDVNLAWFADPFEVQTIAGLIPRSLRMYNKAHGKVGRFDDATLARLRAGGMEDALPKTAGYNASKLAGEVVSTAEEGLLGAAVIPSGVVNVAAKAGLEGIARTAVGNPGWAARNAAEAIGTPMASELVVKPIVENTVMGLQKYLYGLDEDIPLEDLLQYGSSVFSHKGIKYEDIMDAAGKAMAVEASRNAESQAAVNRVHSEWAQNDANYAKAKSTRSRHAREREAANRTANARMVEHARQSRYTPYQSPTLPASLSSNQGYSAPSNIQPMGVVGRMLGY